MSARPVEKIKRTRQRVDRRDNILNIEQCELIFTQNLYAPAHELIVVGDVAGRQSQPLDAGLLGDGDPDFGDEDSFEVGCDQGWLTRHTWLLVRQTKEIIGFPAA